MEYLAIIYACIACVIFGFLYADKDYRRNWRFIATIFLASIVWPISVAIAFLQE